MPRATPRDRPVTERQAHQRRGLLRGAATGVHARWIAACVGRKERLPRRFGRVVKRPGLGFAAQGVLEAEAVEVAHWRLARAATQATAPHDLLPALIEHGGVRR